MNIADIVVHIVDDEEAVRSSLAFLLSGAGFAVRMHESATDFLAVAGNIKNGCLITDLRMPDMSGVELLRRLRDNGALLPAIVITGHGDVQMAVEAMKNGALDFIEKPFSDDVLIDAIHVGHAQVGDQAAIRDGRSELQKVGRRLVHAHGKPGGLQQEGQRVADGFLVIDDVNDGVSYTQRRPRSAKAG